MKEINTNNINFDIIPLVKYILKKDYINNNSNKKYYIDHIINILQKYENIEKYKYKLLIDYINDSNNKEEDIKQIKKILK